MVIDQKMFSVIYHLKTQLRASFNFVEGKDLETIRLARGFVM